MKPRLYDQFEDFHNLIKLDKESSLLKEKRDILQGDFENKFPEKLKEHGITVNKSDLRFIDQGSYRQAISTTIEDKIVDRDVAVIFPLDIEENTDPRKIKGFARDALTITNVREPKIKEPCITVYYLKQGEENIHIDFPLYAEHNGTLYLARGKEFSATYEWEKCDPDGLNEYLESYFAGNEGNQLRRIVRFIKKWRQENYGDSYGKDHKPPSIGLTLLACDYFTYKSVDGYDDDLNVLYAVVNGIINSFILNILGEHTITRNLPVTPNSDVFYKMTNVDEETFYTKLSEFKNNLLNAINANEEYEAAKYIQKSLGIDFKLPDKPKSSSAQSKRENSYA
jgi:hypothetical protein